jgi:hypothetical protein
MNTSGRYGPPEASLAAGAAASPLVVRLVPVYLFRLLGLRLMRLRGLARDLVRFVPVLDRIQFLGRLLGKPRPQMLSESLGRPTPDRLVIAAFR